VAALLTAASLMATMITVLYSLWYPSIADALAVPRRHQRADRDPEIAVVRRALEGRAAPLFVISLLPVAVFLPPILDVISQSEQLLAMGYGKYDSVRAAFAAVYLLTVILAVFAARQAQHLRRKLVELRSTAELGDPEAASR
jgi:hypothetical protein